MTFLKSKHFPFFFVLITSDVFDLGKLNHALAMSKFIK